MSTCLYSKLVMELREICEFQAPKVLLMKLGWPPSFFLGWDLGD